MKIPTMNHSSWAPRKFIYLGPNCQRLIGDLFCFWAGFTGPLKRFAKSHDFSGASFRMRHENPPQFAFAQRPCPN
jgi:hypothetical protein